MMQCTCRSILRTTRNSLVLRSSARPISSSALFQAEASTSAPSKPNTASPQSSCPPGTVFKGLNFLKDGTDPVALEDSAYPDWVWTLAEAPTTGGGAKGAVKADGDKSEQDKLKAARKQMAKENKTAIKAKNTLKSKG
ncbi:hypothetical protein T439DRAFT_379183 [Meredithblackwellia eburnea MCA 4105]